MQGELSKLLTPPPGDKTTPEWEAAFLAWQAHLRDYLLEKEFLLAEMEKRLRKAAVRIPLNPAVSYTSNPESGSYTGLASGEPGSPYAAVADLNALRVAYENLRVLTETLLSRLS